MDRIIVTTEQDEAAIAWAETQGSTFEGSVRALIAAWVQGMTAASKANASAIALAALKGEMTQEQKDLAQSTLDAAKVVEPEKPTEV